METGLLLCGIFVASGVLFALLSPGVPLWFGVVAGIGAFLFMILIGAAAMGVNWLGDRRARKKLEELTKRLRGE